MHDFYVTNDGVCMILKQKQVKKPCIPAVLLHKGFTKSYTLAVLLQHSAFYGRDNGEIYISQNIVNACDKIEKVPKSLLENLLKL